MWFYIFIGVVFVLFNFAALGDYPRKTKEEKDKNKNL